LVSSEYALAEARVNLDTAVQAQRLDKLAAGMEIVPQTADEPALPDGVQLPPKDRPILQAAIRSAAAYLLTGDVRHFGAYFGKTVAGVTTLLPAEYLHQYDRKRSQGK
jgi:hypothetical protein